MNKISILRSMVNNGWTIANRRAVCSQIGKSNFEEIANLANKKGLTGDVFEYQMVKDELNLRNLSEVRKALEIEKPVSESASIVLKKIKNVSGEVEKQPISVKINATRDNAEMVTYNFFDGDKPIGFVQLEEHFHRKNGTSCPPGILLKDYPKLGIEGDRVIVHMLENFDEKTYSGIGNLADKVAIQHCLLHGIEPNVVSEASYQSHLAHYLRGKRFIPMWGEDFNKIFEQIAKTRVTGTHVDTSEYGVLLTYMPREMIQRLKTEVVNAPLFSHKI